jgi:hypothetical protein
MEETDWERVDERFRAYEEGLYAGINLPVRKLKKPECPYIEDRVLIEKWFAGFWDGLLLR